jgi:hypothetical protein
MLKNAFITKAAKPKHRWTIYTYYICVPPAVVISFFYAGRKINKK